MRDDQDVDLTFPVGGIEDTCALCSDTINDEHDVGIIGLNGVLCVNCTHNLGHYTPRWHCIGVNGDKDIEVFQYCGYPDTPFFDSVSECTFIEAPGLTRPNPEELTEYYLDLPEEIQEILWYLGAEELPPDFESVTHHAIDSRTILDVHTARRDVEDDNPYEKVRSYLPRPFIASPNGIHADFSEATITPDEVLEMFLEDATDPTVQTLESFTDSTATDTTQSGIDSFDESENTTKTATETSTDSQTTAETADQAGIGAFLD